MNKSPKPRNKNKNHAYIDGQNLHVSTTKSDDPWRIDLGRFRTYLKDKYKIKYAYYYLGYKSDKYLHIYKRIIEAGFILKFKKHETEMFSNKKGNVDSDIIFKIMKKVFTENKVDSVMIVSGDGDFKNLVDFLIKIGKFNKILFPNKKYASSLYKKLGSEYYDLLDRDDIRKIIEKNNFD